MILFFSEQVVRPLVAGLGMFYNSNWGPDMESRMTVVVMVGGCVALFRDESLMHLMPELSRVQCVDR